jgi:hypothetical protein
VKFKCCDLNMNHDTCKEPFIITGAYSPTLPQACCGSRNSRVPDLLYQPPLSHSVCRADWRGPIRKIIDFSAAKESELGYVKTPLLRLTLVILNYTPHKIMYRAVTPNADVSVSRIIPTPIYTYISSEQRMVISPVRYHIDMDE